MGEKNLKCPNGGLDLGRERAGGRADGRLSAALLSVRSFFLSSKEGAGSATTADSETVDLAPGGDLRVRRRLNCLLCRARLRSPCAEPFLERGKSVKLKRSGKVCQLSVAPSSDVKIVSRSSVGTGIYFPHLHSPGELSG